MIFVRCFLPVFWLLGLQLAAVAQVRITTDLTGEWRFIKSDPGVATAAPAFDDSAWETVQVPHCWNALDGEDGGGDYYRGSAWYRRSFTVDPALAGRRVFIKFHAAQTVANVYVNGTAIGEHRGGYSAFVFDITHAVNIGAGNVLAVRVDNSYTTDVGPESGDFTISGGLTRRVEFLALDPVHVSPLDFGSPGVYLTPKNITATSADLDIKVIAANKDAVPRTVTLAAAILDAEGQVVATVNSNHTLAAGASTTLTQQTSVASPHLWNGRDDPYLYKVRVRLLDGATALDELFQPLGFRYFSVYSNNGFFLNGRYLDLHGTNMHEERKGKGNAVSDVDREQDIAISLDLGCTMVRLAHYQHADYKYSLCDNSGLVVWAEVSQVNRIHDNAAYTANARQQLIELIRQNYNHPSICFWSVSNEITNSTGPNPVPLMQNLAALVAAEDSTRLSTCAQVGTSSNRGRTYNLDSYAMNTYHGWYGGQATDFEGALRSYHSTYPNDSIGIGEYGAGASIHQHEYSPAIPSPGGPWHPEEYQNLFHETHWLAMRGMPFLWCKLIWNGFDFASDGRAEGDSPGINDKGIVTHDRMTLKDSYYWYRSHWNPEPLVYITSRRFDPAPSGTIPVKVYSNASAVRLFVNETLVGEVASTENRFTWPAVALKSGENILRAEATYPSGTVADTITFNWTPAPPSVPYLRINFAPGSAPPATGFLTDTGLPFANRGNGQSYGWNRDVSAEHRVRALDPRAEYDTVAQSQRNGANDSWAIALANGTYYLIAVAGDPGYFDSNFHLLAERQDLVKGAPSDTARWVEGRAVVEVADGVLNIANGPESSNNKLCFIEIRRVVANADLLAYEGFGGVGSTTRASINGYTPDPTTVGIGGAWALAGGNNEDIISRATPDFRGLAVGHRPEFSGSRQHWWEQVNAWGVNRASVKLNTPVDLSSDNVLYMSFLAESGSNNYVAQLGLRNATQELMWGNGYGPGTNGGLTSYIGPLGANVQSNGNNTTVTHTGYKTLLYIARLTKTDSETTNNLKVEIITYNLDDLNGVIDSVAPATWSRTVNLAGVTGIFTHLQAKLDGGGGNYPGMDEFRLGQTWSAVTDLPRLIKLEGSVTARNTTYGTASTAASFTVSGTGLTGNLNLTPPTGFETSLISNGGFGNSTTIIANGNLGNVTAYVRLAAATPPGSHSGEIIVSGGGAFPETLAIPDSTVIRKELSLNSAAVLTKSYDGTSVATITGTLVGIVEPDAVGFIGLGAFASPNAGANIPVEAEVVLNGADAAKYTVAQPMGLIGSIQKADQQITFGALPDRFVDEVFSVSATSSAGLPVTFSSLNANASVNGESVVVTGPSGGSVFLRASQGGNNNFHAASDVTRSFAILARSAASEIRIQQLATNVGTTAGLKITLDFHANGTVDIYASEDLIHWGAPIASGVAASPYVVDNVLGARRFYIVVPAGRTFP